MDIDVSKIPFSHRDRLSGVRLPSKLTPELAEFLGIMIGDGHVSVQKRKKQNGFYYEINICGHIKDKFYHFQYVDELARKLFGISLNKQTRALRNALVLRKQSKAICLFLKEIFHLPRNKRYVGVPNCILQSDAAIKQAFLRGLADSDFYMGIKHRPQPYLVVQGDSKSEKLMRQCSVMLSELGVLNYVRKEAKFYAKRNKAYVGYRIYVNGYKRVNAFMEQVGFQNPNKNKKYDDFLQKHIVYKQLSQS
jgi:intein/homing endonuclease